MSPSGRVSAARGPDWPHLHQHKAQCMWLCARLLACVSKQHASTAPELMRRHLYGFQPHPLLGSM